MVGEYDVERLKSNITRQQLIEWDVYYRQKDDGQFGPSRLEWYLMQMRKQLVYVCAGLGIDHIPNISEKEQLRIEQVDVEEVKEKELEAIKVKHDAYIDGFNALVNRKRKEHV